MGELLKPTAYGSRQAAPTLRIALSAQFATQAEVINGNDHEYNAIKTTNASPPRKCQKTHANAEHTPAASKKSFPRRAQRRRATTVLYCII
jgi:hypothetical protein